MATDTKKLHANLEKARAALAAKRAAGLPGNNGAPAAPRKLRSPAIRAHNERLKQQSVARKYLQSELARVESRAEQLRTIIASL